MNHNYAIENNTAERYVLGELTEPEREDYEEHFFDCPQCAEEVKCATEFVQGARQVFARDQREAVSAVVARAATGTHWFSAFLRPAVGLACVLALAGFTGFQSLVTVPRLKQRASSVQLASEVPTLHESRGKYDPVTVAKGIPFALPFFVKTGEYSSYNLELESESGIKEFSSSFSRKLTGKTLSILVPAGKLVSGKYVLRIQGVNSKSAESEAQKVAATYYFELTIQE